MTQETNFEHKAGYRTRWAGMIFIGISLLVISIRVVFEKPADADPIANIIKPTCNARLRPNRSPSDPIVSNNAANIRT